jgi:hypothetical protein
MKLLAGDLAAAFIFNPLYVVGLAVLAAFNLYAVAVLAGRLPRLRVEIHPPSWGSAFRWGTVAAILGNWAWLIYWGI